MTTTNTDIAATNGRTVERADGNQVLDDARFITLVTLRRSGEPVSTPVLVASDGSLLLVRTAADTGELRLIAANPAVLVAPSDSRGRWLGGPRPGTARVLGPAANAGTLSRLHRRYRLAGPLATTIRRLRGQKDVIVEITLDR
jgi:PPOX class probable F420-dependent enzyme